MGSGLILLVIVAAWLAVLVPMALRSHESSTSLSSVDRFSDAMRVLSRRDAAARARARREAEDDPLSAQAWAENDDPDDDAWDDAWDDDLAPVGWRERLDAWRERLPALPRPSQAHGPSTAADRRRRLLITLVGATVLATVGGLVGPRVLLAVAGLLGLAVVLFVVQLRRLAVARTVRSRPASAARATRAPTRAPTQRPAAPPAPVRRPAPVVSSSVRVQAADVYDDQAVPEQVVAAPAVRHDEPLPAAVSPAPAAALGGAWSPVPIPPPTYVTASRAPRMVDLTRPGAWSQEQATRPAEELPGSAAADSPPTERRRAVNEW